MMFSWLLLIFRLSRQQYIRHKIKTFQSCVMWFFIYVVFIGYVFHITLVETAVMSSGYACGGSGWEIDHTDNAEMFIKMQKWLYAWQNNCELPFYEGMAPGNGIGSSIMGMSNWFEYAYEHGSIYRPYFTYPWAEGDKTNCTFSGIGSVDCYFQPLSTCHLPPNAVLDPLYVNKLTQEERERDLQFSPLTADSCALARIAKKSLQWVHGNFLHYLVRFNNVVQTEFERRGAAVLAFLNSEELKARNGATVSVHIRGGNPDDGRRILPIAEYMQAIDNLAEELQAQGRPVLGVFLCSDTPEQNFISVAHMTEKYPRPWRYLAVPQYRLRQRREGDQLETSYYVRKHPEEERESMIEFLIDMEFLTRMDVFLGSDSNMYPLVAGRRIAMDVNGRNGFPGHSCALLTSSVHQEYQPPTIHCEARKDASKEIILESLHFVRGSGVRNAAHVEVYLIQNIVKWSRQFPAVDALMSEPLRELPPDRDDKERVCAYPGCNIDGKGLFSKMLKCGRCRSVYYCSSLHQKSHWKDTSSLAPREAARQG